MNEGLNVSTKMSNIQCVSGGELELAVQVMGGKGCVWLSLSKRRMSAVGGVGAH